MRLILKKSIARWLEMARTICCNNNGFLIANALHNRR